MAWVGTDAWTGTDAFPPFEAPPTPLTLTATVISASQIDLSWTAVPAASGYDIERDGTVIVYGRTATTYSDTGLSAGSHSYRVRSVE